MKKYVILSIAIIIFVAAYFVTNSWKISLIILGIAGIYLMWLIGAELGLFNVKDKIEYFEQNFKKEKKRFNRKSENNPTIR